MATQTSSSVPTPDDRADRLFTGAFVRLALADLAYFTADGVAIFALPLYVTGPVQSNSAGAGLAFGAFAVSALVLRPFVGRLCDSVGRRPVLLVGAALCAVAMLLTAYVESLALIVVLRLVLGVAEAAFFVASFAVLADLAPPSRLGEALSYNSLGLYLGLALGPLIGDYLVSTVSFTAAWLGAAALALLATAIVVGIGETREPRSESHEPAQLIHRKAIPPAIGFLTSIVAMGGFLAFAALHAEAIGLTNASTPLVVYGGVVVICRILFAKVPDRLPPLSLGAAALVAVALGLVVIALWAAPVGMILGATLLALGITFTTPAFFSAVFATAKPSERGAASGTFSAFIDLGIGGGPILLGLVAQAAGIPWAFGLGAIIAICGSAWTFVLQARPGFVAQTVERR